MRLTRSTAMAAAMLIGASGAAFAQNQTSGSGAGGSASSGATGTQAGQQPLTNQEGVSSQGGTQQGTVQQAPRGMSQLEAQALQRRLQQQGNRPVGQQGQGTIGSGTAGQQTIGGTRSQGGPAQRTTPQQRDFDAPESGPGAQLDTGANRFDQMQFDFDNLTPQEQQLLLQGRLGGTAGGGSGQVNMPQDRLDRLRREQFGDLTEEEFLQLQREGRLMGNNEFLSSRELASTMRRLAALEDRLLQRNEMLLQRLGQARQLPPERQVAAVSEVLQQVLIDHEHMIGYMGELRVVLQSQSEFGSGEFSDRGTGRDFRGTAGPNPRNVSGNRTLGSTGVRQGNIQPQRFQWEIETDSRSGGQAPGQRVLGTDEVDDTWQDWQDFRREERPR